MSAERTTVVVGDEPSLRAALRRLRSEAPGARVLDVRSSVPLSEDLASLVPTRRSRAPLWGISGGIGGALGGWLLAAFTSKAYPVVTGHMPIIPAPTSGIVIYEGIALGAVLATTLCVLLEGGLLGRRRRPVETEPRAPGAIEVTLESDDSLSSDLLRRAFEPTP